jgi:hypothetical protein
VPKIYDPGRKQGEKTTALLGEIRDALYQSNRAFIFVKKIDAQFVGQKSTHTIIKWRFVAQWENGGKTPTKDAASYINYGLFEGSIDLGFHFPDFGEQQEAGHTMLGPGGSTHGHVDIPIENLHKVKAGRARAYIWGWMDYNDVFPNTRRHRSEFCVEVVVDGEALEEKCHFSFRQHERFNGFDGECMRNAAPYSPSGFYKFLDTRDIDRVIVDGTLKVSSASHYRTLDEGKWGAIADPLEAASLLTVPDNFVIRENSPELEIANKANIGLGAFQKFAAVSGGGQINISGAKFIHATTELFIYSAAVGDLNRLTAEMCVKAERPYNACLKIADMGALRERIFDTGRIRGLDCKVSDLFEPGLIQRVEYEDRTRDIREGPVVEPSPFKKETRFKSQSEVRLLLVPKSTASIPRQELIIEIPDPRSLFEEVFRDYQKD